MVPSTFLGSPPENKPYTEFSRIVPGLSGDLGCVFLFPTRDGCTHTHTHTNPKLFDPRPVPGTTPPKC